MQDIVKSEIYNPINNESSWINETPWRQGIIAPFANSNCTVLLHDGKVVFIDEYENVIYDPDKNNYSRQVIPVINNNSIGSAILLNNQKILIICEQSGNGLIFEPQSQNVYPVPNKKKLTKYIEKINLEDVCYKTILLNNGNVLITSNYFIFGFMRYYTPLLKAEIYNPKLNRILPSAEMNEKRFQYTATLLKSGNVLFVGGSDNYSILLWPYKDKRVAKTAELFIP